MGKKRGKRDWAPEATLVLPDPNIEPYDLELIDSQDYVGLFFEVQTGEVTGATFNRFIKLVALLSDCEVVVEHCGAVWSTIAIHTTDKKLARVSMEDAARFYQNIPWEEHPRELGGAA